MVLLASRTVYNEPFEQTKKNEFNSAYCSLHLAGIMQQHLKATALGWEDL